MTASNNHPVPRLLRVTGVLSGTAVRAARAPAVVLSTAALATAGMLGGPSACSSTGADGRGAQVVPQADLIDGGALTTVPSDGEIIEAMPRTDPFADGYPLPDDDAGGSACDNDAGDVSACASGGGGTDGGSTCLTAATCGRLTQFLSPRSAAAAMTCVNSLPAACTPKDVADCAFESALRSCSPVAAGTSPCDVVASACASNDPWGTVDLCLSMTASFTAPALDGMRTCLLSDAGACDPHWLTTCVSTLFP